MAHSLLRHIEFAIAPLKSSSSDPKGANYRFLRASDRSRYGDDADLPERLRQGNSIGWLSHLAIVIGGSPLRLSLALVFAICVAFYIATAGAYHEVSSPSPASSSYFNLLTDAFLHGQTSLLVKPSPELLALPDPYDPPRNAPFLWDTILYKGHYYLYWGVSPVLLAYLPFRAVTRQYLADGVTCALFASVGLLLNILLIAAIRKDHFPASHPSTTILLVLLLGFGNMVPFILRRPVVYEVAITCGYMLTAAFLYFAYEGGYRGSLKPAALFTSGVLLGLAFLSRTNLAAYGLVLAVPFLLHRYTNRSSTPSRWRLIVVAFLPAALCVFFQACYNSLRFGSPAEFGLQYDLSGISVRNYHFFSFARGINSAVYYLFNIPNFSPLFPFVTARGIYGGLVLPLRWVTKMLQPHIPDFAGVEPVAGIFIAVPLLVVLFGLASFLRASTVSRDLRWFAVTMLASAVIVAGASCVLFGATMRYELDFLPALLLAAGTLLFWIERKWGSAFWRRLFRTGLPVLVCYSVLVSAGMSFTGYTDWFRLHHARRFDSLERTFRPVERVLLRMQKENPFGAMRARVTLPFCDPAVGQPLLVTGYEGQLDTFSLHCMGQSGALRVAWDHTGAATKLGPVFTVASQELTIEMTSPALFPRTRELAGVVYGPGTLPPNIWDQISKTCIVRINGNEVFHDNNCDMYPNGLDAIFRFENPFWGQSTSMEYSGKVLSIERVPLEKQKTDKLR